MAKEKKNLAPSGKTGMINEKKKMKIIYRKQCIGGVDGSSSKVKKEINKKPDIKLKESALFCV